MTKIIKVSNDYSLSDASNSIKNGNLVIFPTETVYGIGANGLSENAVKKIFIAKGRVSDNPLIMHVSSINMLEKITKNITDIEYKLINAFMPGPFTIILNKQDIVPNVVTGGLDTVGVRMPNNEVALELIRLADLPIAAPSANISGRPSGTNIEDIFEELQDKVDYIIDEGQTRIGIESTVVRVIGDEVHILRPGYITNTDILKVHDKVVIDGHLLKPITNKDKVLSPGMKYKHYAPNTKCILVYSTNNNKLIEKIKELSTNNSVALVKQSNTKYFNNAISMGETNEEIAKNIFKLLRKVDTLNRELIIIEGVSKDGLGLAIMNRLIRACEYNYIEI